MRNFPKDLEEVGSDYRPDDLSSEENIRRNISGHYDTYSALLDLYDDAIKKDLEEKRGYKEKYYTLSINVLKISIILLIVAFVFFNDNREALIGAVVSFLTVFIVIPKTIAQYLFDEQESQNIIEIIKAVQKHDEFMYSKIYHADKTEITTNNSVSGKIEQSKEDE